MDQLRPAARIYLTSVSVAGLALLIILVYLDRGSFADLGRGEVLGVFQLFLFFTLFSFLTSLSPVNTPSGLTFSVNLAPLYAAVVTLPPGLACLAAVIGTIDQRIPGRQIAWYRFIFIRGSAALAYGAGALVFHGLTTLQPPSPVAVAINLPLISAGLLALVTIAVLNAPMIIVAIALTTGEPIRKIAYQSLQGAILSYAGLAPLGALLAYLQAGRQVTGIFMGGIIFILLIVYRELSRRSLKLQTVARGSYVAQSRLIDKKDRSTFGHSERVGLLSEATAAKMRLSAELVEQVRIGATLHDIGKIAIPDSILHKSDKLTDEEWTTLKTHPREGYEVLQEQEVLLKAAGIVLSHHENFDGSGYPEGTAGRAIPVGGRIARVVDSYDCITNVRDYRTWVREPFEALAEIATMAGSTYDPEVVRAFTQVLIEREPVIADRLAEGQEQSPGTPMEALQFIPFLKIWTAQGLSNFGDMLTTTGLALAAFGSSHSTLAVGAIFAIRALPNLLFGLVAGQLVDRYDRKALMLGMDILRACLIGALPFIIGMDLWLILVIAFLASCATVVFNPARAAVLPDLLPYRLLQPGNSAITFAERVTEIGGYAAAAAMILVGGVALVFSIDAATFMISAGLILTIRFPDMLVDARPRQSWSRLRQDIAIGLNYIRHKAELRVIFPFSFFMVAAGSALLPLMVPMAVVRLGAGSAGFALLEASIAVGATVGALLTGVLQSARRGVLMATGGLGMGICTVLAAFAGSLPVAMIFFAAAGVANTIYLVPMVTAIQEATESEIRGRVFSARYTLVQLGIVVGTIYAAAATSPLLQHLLERHGFTEPATIAVAVAASGMLMMMVSSAAAMSAALRRI